MRISKSLRACLSVAICVAMALPHSAMANAAAAQVVDGVKISQTVKDLRLGSNGTLSGVIVDETGKPVASAPVVIGQKGKPFAEFDTGADGRYAVSGLKPGVYQVVSFAGVETVRVHKSKDAPAGAIQGIVQVITSDGIARGQSCNNGCNQCNDAGCKDCSKPRYSRLRSVLTNPLTWALVLAAAIAIPLALDDDAS